MKQALKSWGTRKGGENNPSHMQCNVTSYYDWGWGEGGRESVVEKESKRGMLVLIKIDLLFFFFSLIFPFDWPTV